MIKVVYTGTIEKSWLDEAEFNQASLDILHNAIVESIKEKVSKSSFGIGQFTYEPSDHLKKGIVYFSVTVDLLPDAVPGSSSG
jgi:hypothetical protein